MNTTTDLKDGLAYNIHLRNGRTIYKAIYHHCALSDKHYFTKRDMVYPIEDVACHSMKGMEIEENATPQILTDHYCGHLIEVTFTSVIPHCELSHIPDSVFGCIMEQLKENVCDGEFSEEETGDCFDPEDETRYTVTAGTWRVVELNHNLLYRIGAWNYNRRPEESLTLELFVENYGKVQGEHYYSKWMDYYSQHFINMVGYLNSNSKEAQIFCDMIMQKVKQYEQRIQSRK